MDPLRHVKPAVRALGAYTLAERPAEVKLNQNENPWDLPEALKRRVLAQALARPWSRYPAFDPRELLQALAGFSGWRADGILAGNGSNELIEALLVVTVGAGTRVVIPEPTFTLYALLTTILGGEAMRVMLRKAGRLSSQRPAAASLSLFDPGPESSEPARPPFPSDSSDPSGPFVYDVDDLLEARRTSGASLTIVCSPNNPTGSSLPLADVDRLCGDSDGLVVIDEAYHEFAGASVVPLLARHPNLVVLRTFSKAMGMAGLRVGYLLASPELVREVNKARLPYNVNFFSQLAALAALEERETLAGNVRRLVEGRERLLARLADMPGVRAHASDANFFLLEVLTADPKAVFDAMARRGVLVRDLTSYPLLERCLRVSVGTEEENDAFLHALGTALTEAGALVAEGTSVRKRAAGKPRTRALAGGLGGAKHSPEQRKQAHRPPPVTPLKSKAARRAARTARTARVERRTRETDITLVLNLDGQGRSRIKTGVGFFDHMLTSLATHSRIDLDVRCKGDLHVDAHHSVEDVGIAFGQALKQATGDKKGLVRFGHAYVPLDEALSRAVVDLSGRPWLHFGVQFRAQRIGDMPTELFEDFFWALVDHGRFNLHLDVLRGRNSHHIAETLFKATARALAMAVARDPRVVGVPSTKGSL